MIWHGRRKSLEFVASWTDGFIQIKLEQKLGKEPLAFSGWVEELIIST